MKRILVLAFLIFLSFQSVAQTEKSELTQIIKTALDLPELQEYFHVNADTTRIPIAFQASKYIDVNSVDPIVKFGKEVVFIKETELQKTERGNFITIVSFKMDFETCELAWQYPIEGVTVVYKFSKQGTIWNLDNFDISER